jgi:hypothetical protein
MLRAKTAQDYCDFVLRCCGPANDHIVHLELEMCLKQHRTIANFSLGVFCGPVNDRIVRLAQ